MKKFDPTWAQGVYEFLIKNINIKSTKISVKPWNLKQNVDTIFLFLNYQVLVWLCDVMIIVTLRKGLLNTRLTLPPHLPLNRLIFTLSFSSQCRGASSDIPLGAFIMQFLSTLLVSQTPDSIPLLAPLLSQQVSDCTHVNHLLKNIIDIAMLLLWWLLFILKIYNDDLLFVVMKYLKYTSVA